MSDTTNEIIKRIEQDDEFRETYYDNIDRLVDKQQNQRNKQRIAEIPLYPFSQQENPHAKNLSHRQS